MPIKAHFLKFRHRNGGAFALPFFFSLDPCREVAYTRNIPPSFACLANILMTTQICKYLRLLADIVALFAVCFCGSVVSSRAAQPIDFARDIRPILSKCVACHGPAKQENGLRLDNAKDAAKLKAIIAGKQVQKVAVRQMRVGNAKVFRWARSSNSFIIMSHPTVTFRSNLFLHKADCDV